MPPAVDFRRYCEAKIGPCLAGLEIKRRGVLKIGAAFLAVAAVIVGTFLFHKSGPISGFFFPVLLAAPVLAVMLWIKWAGFRSAFKCEVMPHVVRFLDPSLCYEPEGKINQAKFAGSQLFRRDIDRYEGEDRVHGRLDKTVFEFSEIHAEYKTEGTDDKGKRSQSWHTIFRGIYFVADFNKNFRSHTVVLPDSLEKRFGFIANVLQSINPGRDDLIRLEDSEFEREFVVYGQDQVEARYILTPALMQRMLALRNRIGGKIYFAFLGSEVHVAIATSKDRFEPKLFKSARVLDDIGAYLDDLKMVTAIVDDLNLNTRIWSKD